MKATTILVIGYDRQTQTAHQIDTLKKMGANVIIIDPYGDEGYYAPLLWQGGKMVWQGIEISPGKIDAILVCSLPPETPTEDAFQAHDGLLSWEEWYQHFGLQRDRSDTLLSLLLCHENAGTPMYNPPGQSMLSRRKPYQLSLLRKAECNLPTTLVSNAPRAAEAFVRYFGDCVIKPAAGGSLTLSANELIQTTGLNKLSAGPAILQQRIAGEDIRVMMVDGKVISSAAICVPQGTLDFRGDPDYEQGKATYREVELPKSVQLECRRASAILGLRFTGIDLKYTEKGEYFMLECNSSPIYLDVEHKLKHPITERLCEAILAAA